MRVPRSGWPGLAAILVAACASPPPASVIEVVNHSRHSIASVVQTPCGGGDPQELLRDEIERGDSRRVSVTERCVDLMAVDSRGRIVGQQRELEVLSDATWTIR